MQRILVIDDDPAVTRLLKRGLFYEGFSVILAGSGEAGLTLARDFPADLVVLEIVLPGIDGLEVLRRLHVDDPQLPVLILTAKDAPADQVLGLESGADDYVVKPFTFAVLLARIRALLRRQYAEHPSVLTFTDLTLDTSSRQVYRGRREIVLTSLEFKLLQIFLEHPQQVLTKDALLGLAWSADFNGSQNVVEVYVKQLRQKLEAGGESRLLHTIRGAGYILRELQATRQDDGQEELQQSSANLQPSLKSPTGNRGTIPSSQ
jgi:DNA-binding response OmpR family regulator